MEPASNNTPINNRGKNEPQQEAGTLKYARLWIGLALVFVFSFAVLGYYGGEIYQAKPPIPRRVVTTAGDVLFTEKDILEGQNVWQSMGGQEIGTVWGHGAYTAPDWTADWLHRECLWILDA
jgi:nitric oxide reductase subunit B